MLATAHWGELHWLIFKRVLQDLSHPPSCTLVKHLAEKIVVLKVQRSFDTALNYRPDFSSRTRVSNP